MVEPSITSKFPTKLTFIKISESVITKRKSNFSRFVIQNEIILEKGAQFTTENFHKFAENTILLMKSGNFKAKRKVKEANNLLLKCKVENEYPYIGIANIEIPYKVRKKSPIEMMVGRRTRTNITYYRTLDDKDYYEINNKNDSNLKPLEIVLILILIFILISCSHLLS